jgi:AcrR family transcriptional regulator
MSVNPPKIPQDARQREAAEYFVTNDFHQMTHAQIAEKVGVSERTLYRWKKDPEFAAYVNYLSDQVMHSFIAEASTELRNIVRHGSDKDKLKGIELVYKANGKMRDVQDQTVTVRDERTTESVKAEIEELKRKLNEG